MKLQLNFDQKTVTLENDVNMGDFFQWFSEKIDNWKEWTVKTNTVVEWREPIVIERHNPFVWPRPYHPNDPVYVCQPTITYLADEDRVISDWSSPVINLEIN